MLNHAEITVQGELDSARADFEAGAYNNALFYTLLAAQRIAAILDKKEVLQAIAALRCKYNV
jgi:hypothetical protein